MLLLARKPYSQLVLVVFDYCSHHLDIPKYPCRHRCFFHYILLQQCMKKRLKLNNLQYIFSGFGILDNNYPSFSKRTASTCCRFFSVYFDLCKFANKKNTVRNRIFGHCRIDPGTGFRGMMRLVEFFLLVTHYSPFSRFSLRGWQLKYFSFSLRSLGKMNPFWFIFFNWVETTNQFSLRGWVALFLATQNFLKFLKIWQLEWDSPKLGSRFWAPFSHLIFWAAPCFSMIFHVCWRPTFNKKSYVYSIRIHSDA